MKITPKPPNQSLRTETTLATRISAALTLTGSGFDPDKVTQHVGVVPTKTYRMGEQIQKTLLRQKYDVWSFSTGLQESLDLCHQVHALLDQLQPYLPTLATVCQRWHLDAEIECVIYAEGQIPAIHFNLDDIKRIAELGAEIDVDLYYLPTDGDESDQET